MKSFKQYLNEDESSPNPDASLSVTQGVDPNLTTDDQWDKGDCERIQQVIDYYYEILSRLEALYYDRLNGYLEQCGGDLIDRALRCAKYCGAGGEWGPQGWRDYSCMEQCLESLGNACEYLLQELSDDFDEILSYYSMIELLENELSRHNCNQLPRSTRKPDPSGKPNTGVTPIKPIEPNIGTKL
jgi:hypothetical protein